MKNPDDELLLVVVGVVEAPDIEWSADEEDDVVNVLVLSVNVIEREHSLAGYVFGVFDVVFVGVVDDRPGTWILASLKLTVQSYIRSDAM